jgi:hypothetical protein
MVEMSNVGVELASYTLKHQLPLPRQDELKVYGMDTLLLDEILFCLAKAGLGSGVTIGGDQMMVEMFYRTLAFNLSYSDTMSTYVKQLFARRGGGHEKGYHNIFKKKLHTFSTRKFLSFEALENPAKLMIDLIDESKNKNYVWVIDDFVSLFSSDTKYNDNDTLLPLKASIFHSGLRTLKFSFFAHLTWEEYNLLDQNDLLPRLDRLRYCRFFPLSPNPE